MIVVENDFRLIKLVKFCFISQFFKNEFVCHNVMEQQENINQTGLKKFFDLKFIPYNNMLSCKVISQI